MLKVNFEFIRIGNKLTGLRLNIITSTKSFNINFCWAQRKQIEPLKVCFTRNYLPSGSYTESHYFKSFREVIGVLSN